MTSEPPAWACYYDTATGTLPERVTDDDAGDDGPYGVPARGVIVIAQEDPTAGRILLSGDDYYWWRPGDGWFGGDIFGLWDYLATPGEKRVLFGRTIPTDRYEAIVDRARADDYLPSKTATHGYREARGDR